MFEEESCNDASRYESADFNVMKSTATKEKEKLTAVNVRRVDFLAILHMRYPKDYVLLLLT